MKTFCLAIVLIFTSAAIKAQTQDPWTEYMTPSSIHSMLGQYTGKFNMEITMSTGEGNETSPILINATNSMVLGGRFLEIKQEGDMMGMDYQSIMILGYNNIDKQMALTTITNMGTGTLSLFGVWDEKTKSADLFGELTNPVTKAVINVRQTITFVNADTILIESYDTEGTKPENKTVQYRLIRDN